MMNRLELARASVPVPVAMLLLLGCTATSSERTDGHETGGAGHTLARAAHAPRTQVQLNLGRTSLASVDASSVNGGRPMDNPFYGVRNAFDDGGNWVGGIQYPYWLSSGEAQPWIDVRFDVPVALVRVDVEASPLTGFSLRLELEEGGERELLADARPPRPEPEEPDPRSGLAAAAGGTAEPGSVASLVLEEPAAGVRALRIRFRDTGSTPLRVYEVRVLGSAPSGPELAVGLPRVVASERNALLAASELFESWKRSLFEGLTPRIEEQADAFVVTYSRAGRSVCCVRMHKTTGLAELEALVDPPWDR